MSQEVTITVLFDNEAYVGGLQTGWGFSALLEGVEKRILFDTAANWPKLSGNMKRFGIEVDGIDAVVLSHIHPDHTGGLYGLLENKADIEVYVPVSFPAEFKNKIKEFGARLIEVGQSLQICKEVYSTGQIGRLIKEQGLIIKTQKASVLITGCAHPGVIKMAEAAKKILADEILLLMGGFHLEWSVTLRIKSIISHLKKRYGLRYAAASHCTGKKAIRLFEKAFGDNYISTGAGKVIKIDYME